MKRFRPRAQGRGYKIIKRTSAITIELKSRPETEEFLRKKKAGELPEAEA